MRLKEEATEFSWNVGVGVTFETSGGSQFFVEARYEAAETANTTEYIPVVFGFRW